MTTGDLRLPARVAFKRVHASRSLPSALAVASALVGAAAFGCGARSSLTDFDATAGNAGTVGGSTGGMAGASPSSGGACSKCTGTCSDGRCLVTLASKQSNTFCLAVDRQSVYWATADLPNAGAINRIPLAGGVFSTISTTPSAPWPCSMAVSEMFVYWADGSTGSVLRARTRGGVSMTLAADVQANFIALDATSVYWSGEFGYPSKVPLAGGALTKLTDSYGATALAIDATSVYWTTRGVDRGQGSVQKVSLAGGAPMTLAAGQDDPEGIAVDASGAYFTSYGAGTVRRVSLDGSALATLAIAQFNPSVLAVDETTVYWSTTSALQKVAKDGGVVTTLANTQAFDIKVDATSVYWTDGRAVMKLTPK